MSQDLSAFRREARDWLAASFPATLAADPALQAVDVHGPPNTHPDHVAWKRRMGEKGWGVPTWPRAYGGGGLSRAEAAVLAEEMARIGAANPIAGMSVSLLGPTLLEFGDEAQKRRHLPPAARGETRWCQGYSEPGAGSDLAALQCRAEDHGDHFRVTGQKLWTSGAHYADGCFCLVRTDTTRKHEGVSFLLIDMRAPGVEARPIPLIYGGSTFCEVFFTDVAVPKENLVGPLNGGWTIAKRLLQFERTGIGGARERGDAPSLAERARAYGGAAVDGRLLDGDLRARISAHDIDARALDLTLERLRAEARAGQAGPAADSVLKNAAAAVSAERRELLIEILGGQGLGWDGDAYRSDELAIVRDWLADKARSIYGGTTEIQNNVIAKRILGLPAA
ncbi:acyl-CoA dehydrogenase family protein [Phenylobacterium sp.]|uniref:acyl-CoA dehydrogenase family protein n=1 Tax=Phenylobacterium sp. TaxID=1871053 RepID=UPI0025E83337|nr:acyl-CoA dehydrogenase family protein [Phenylobacterium sp.]MBX3482046.1 acyl-CoA dehydrogenase family protein [Phenylobacterium sp.]MCW5758511.1 acyl-CoA dehydrogenase family protein [Phenylobacterium sp.]